MAFLTRSTIERLALERLLSARFGGEVQIGMIEHHAANRTLHWVRLTTAGGGLELQADRVAQDADPAGQRVDVGGLRLTLHAEKLRGDELAQLARLPGLLGDGSFAAQTSGGRIEVTRAGTAARLTFSALAGTYQRSPQHENYSLTARLSDDQGGADLSAHGALVGSRMAHALTLDRLSLATLGALLPTGGLALRAGAASEIALVDRPFPQLTAQLDGVEARVGGRVYHDVHGSVALVADGVGSTGLHGTIEVAPEPAPQGASVSATPLADTSGGERPQVRNVPFDVVGEVHDVREFGRALVDGSADLRGLGEVIGLMADEPRVKWIEADTTAPGIAFGQVALETGTPEHGLIPHVVSLLEINPHEPTLHFGTAIADDHVIATGERTSDLARRTGAVAGVNANYFDIGRTYEPQGLVVRDGTMLHGPTDQYALAIDRNNAVTMDIFRLEGTVTDGPVSYPISQFNSWPARYATVITPDYGAKLKPANMMFARLAPLGGETYRVVSVESARAGLPVHLGIGFGDKIVGPLPRPGDTLTVHDELIPKVSGLMTAVSSGPLLVKDGIWFEDTHAPAPDERDVRWPVIALATQSDGRLLLVAVDGRHPERSIGMTRPEFGDLLISLHAIDAMALDSGGSVTMVSRIPGAERISVRNVPSDDHYERYISNALLVYSSAPLGTIVTTPLAPAHPAGAR